MFFINLDSVAVSFPLKLLFDQNLLGKQWTKRSKEYMKHWSKNEKTGNDSVLLNISVHYIRDRAVQFDTRERSRGKL